MGHDVQRPAPDARLGRLLIRSPTRHTFPEDRLHPEHRRLTQRSLVIPRLPLPRLPTDPPDAAKVLIPSQPWTGRVAMPPDLRITPGRDHRTGPPPVQLGVHRTTVVRPIRPHARHRVLHLLQQGGDRLRIGHPRLADHRRLDLVRLGIDSQMELQPGPTLRVAMLSDFPLPLAIDLQPGAVEDQVERPLGTFGQRDAKRGGAAAEGGVIRDGQVQAHQAEEGPGEPLGGLQGEVINGPQGQQAWDRQIAVLELGPLLVWSLMPPCLQRVLIDPEGERAPSDQGVVGVLPVADAVDGLRRGLASGHETWGATGLAKVRVWPIGPVYQSSQPRRTPSCNNAPHNATHAGRYRGPDLGLATAVDRDPPGAGHRTTAFDPHHRPRPPAAGVPGWQVTGAPPASSARLVSAGGRPEHAELDSIDIAAHGRRRGSAVAGTELCGRYPVDQPPGPRGVRPRRGQAPVLRPASEGADGPANAPGDRSSFTEA